MARETATLFAAFVRNAPGGAGQALRRRAIRRAAGTLGRDCHIDTGVVMTGLENISIGSHVNICRLSAMHAHNNGRIDIGSRVSINTNCTVSAADGGVIRIGDDVLIAQNVVLRAADHGHDRTDIPIARQGHVPGTIVIEDGAWIGANAVVTRDVTVGGGAIVAAGAVVTRDVPPFTVVAGVPARVIRERRQSSPPPTTQGPCP